MMEAVNMKCPNCMGSVLPFGNGVYGRCDSCGTTFKLRDDDDVATDEYDEEEYDEEEYDEEDEDDEEEGVDFEEFFDDEYREYVGTGAVLTSAYFGPRLLDNPDKRDQAVTNFDVDEDVDDVWFVMDTTIFGSCKKGFAITSEGVYLVDEDNDSASLDWEDFDDQTISREGGKVYIGGYYFITSDAEARIVRRVLRDLQSLG